MEADGENDCKFFLDGECGSGCENGGYWKGNCYWKFPEGQGTPGYGGWRKAQRACSQQGGNLASIHSKEENEVVRKVCGDTFVCWIGLREVEGDGDWQWVDESPFRFKLWERGEPNNHEGQDE